MKQKKSLKPLQDKFVIRTALVCLIGLGGFLVWGAAVPLEEGVSASGSVVVDGQRKVVQHLEGGIIEEILVNEGQRVEEGDVIVVLKDTASLASRDQTIQEYASLAASVDRLQVLLADGDAPTFSALGKLELGAQERQDVIERELDLFNQQRDGLTADLAVLSARRDAAKQTQRSREQQISIAKRSLATARDELSVVRSMFEQQLARRDQYTSAQRQAVNLESEIAQLRSELKDAASAEIDLNAQIKQAKAQFSQELTATLLETRAQLLSAEERLSATQDVLDRSVIKAPVTGKILNMQFATIGGVVRPGETIMEIIPNVGEITASVQIRPSDRASVYEEQSVRTQVSAYKGWQVPHLEGRVVDISADLKTDPVTSADYYEARILISAEEMQRVENLNVIPGMPVDVFIYSGRSRTMFDYLLEPLRESIFRGLRSS